MTLTTGTFPGSTTYPGAALYPGRGSTLGAYAVTVKTLTTTAVES